ncbi:MAG: hypothetical protein Q4G69_03015 [Planctomycetia bacterium]|nr:hypothetical protein [Planctomycetia bacterium]
MYTEYWELDKKPFEIGCDPNFYYPSESFQSILLKLRYSIESRHGSALLRGPVGSGKSMIATMLLQQLTAKGMIGSAISVRMPQLNADEILCYLAENLDTEGKMFPSFPSGNTEGGLRIRLPKESTPFLYHAVGTVEKILTKNAREKRHSLLIVEDAQQISDARVYPLFKSLLGLEYAGKPALSILFIAAAPTFSEEPQAQFVRNCIDTVAELDPFSESECAAYIAHRLVHAGAKNPIFSDDAITAIAQHSEGLPRRINRICDLALLVGYAEHLESIDAEIIDALDHEMSTAEMK